METIKTRRSIRNYTGESLSEEHKSKFFQYINNEKHLVGPFGRNIRLVYKELTQESKSEKIGTYGFIKNAPAFLIAIAKRDKESMIDVGYVFENLVLFLHAMGIGTCWLGGTFNRKKLQLEQNFENDEFIPIISPVGYAENNKHFVEKLVRKLANSNTRKPFDQLFFKSDFNTQISDATLRDLLEYVRLAPSASNKQPWRLVIDDNQSTHFYIKRTPNYEKSLGYDIQMVDIGIALSHFMVVSGKKQVFINKPDLACPNKNYDYVLSVR